MLTINEYDEYDDYDYYESDKETYYYTVYYITYYKDETNFLSPIREYIDNKMNSLPIDDDTDDDIYKALSKEEHKIDSAVAKGEYEGLWIHRIDIAIYSNYKQIDVDDWSGSSEIGDIEVDSTEITIPKDWTDEDDDFSYLADYALRNKDNINESIMNMAVRKHYKERAVCNESLESFEVGKRYSDFSMLEPFIINYDVDLNELEIGDIIIRDWQYGHLPNTGYIPMEVLDINDKAILVYTNEGQHYISNDRGISKDAMYHRLDRDFLYE
jgi:hypothetical protein